MERFGDSVRKARISLGMKIPDVAEKLGYTAVHLSDIERGQRNPPAAFKVREWAEVVGLDPDEMETAAKHDVAVIKVQVYHDPKKAQLAHAFARRLDTMNADEQNQLLNYLKEGSDE